MSPGKLNKAALPVLVYAAVVAVRPFNHLLGFDPSVVNPPGQAGDFIAGMRLTYYLILPLLYVTSALLLMFRRFPGRLLLALAVLLEFLILGAYLFVLAQLDMLFGKEAPAWMLACLYMLIPVVLLAATLRVRDNKKAMPGI